MIKSKFIKLFQTLSASEVQEFQNFLYGNYDAQKKVLKIFDYILYHQSNWESEAFIKEKAIPAIFPSAPPNNKVFSSKLSQLLGYLEEFLLLKKLREKPFSRNLLMAEILKERGQQDLFNKHLVASESKIEALPERDMWYFLNKLSLTSFRYYALEEGQLHSKKSSGIFQELLNYLDQFFVIAKLKFAVEYQQRRRVLQQEEIDIAFWKEIEAYLERDEALLNPVVKIYYLIYKSNQDSTSKHFNELKELVIKYIDLIRTDDKTIVYKYLLNQLALYSKRSEPKVLEYALEIFRFGLASKLALYNGYMSSIFFNNVADVACKLGEISWADSFCKKWAKYLPKKEKESAINLAKATIAFSRQEFLKALSLLNKIPPNDIHFKTRLRWISLCCHYELKDSPEDHIDPIEYFKKYENFFKRQTDISPDNKEGSLNLLRFVRYLYSEKKSKEEIIEELKDTRLIYFKTWLIEKLKSYQPKK